MSRGARAALLAVAGLVQGCGGDPQATIALSLTDAPYPFDLVERTEVRIDSVGVLIRPPGGEAELLTVDRTGRTLDLAELRNGVTAPLGRSPVPAGLVEAVRVHLGAAAVTLGDGRSFSLPTPPEADGGVEVAPDPVLRILEGDQVELLLDFDLSRSFRITPGTPARAEDIAGVEFHPVLRAADSRAVGSISGTVRSGTSGPLSGAAVVATADGELITSTASDAGGEYVLMGLPPGLHTVTASTSAGHARARVDVTVEAGLEASGVDLELRALP